MLWIFHVLLFHLCDSHRKHISRSWHQSSGKLWYGTSKAYQEGKYTYNDIFMFSSQKRGREISSLYYKALAGWQTLFLNGILTAKYCLLLLSELSALIMIKCMEATNIKHCFLITAIDSIPGQMREHLVNVFIEQSFLKHLGWDNILWAQSHRADLQHL